MKKIVFLVIICSWLLSGWAWGATPESYVPLKAGMVWEYQNKLFDLKTRGQIGAGRGVKKNQAQVDLQGTRVTPQVFSFYEPDNVLKQENTSYIAQDASGFYVFARKAANDTAPQVVAPRYYVLKFPLTPGASWKQEAQGYIMQDTIESTNASVQVPAGSFADCLLVKKLFFSPGNPGTPVQEAQFWFAPEVGNVKAIIKNSQENKEMVQELKSLKK